MNAFLRTETSLVMEVEVILGTVDGISFNWTKPEKEYFIKIEWHPRGNNKDKRTRMVKDGKD